MPVNIPAALNSFIILVALPALTLLYVPPMITAAILATEHDLDPPLANLMVAVGVVLSFATLPAGGG